MMRALGVVCGSGETFDPQFHCRLFHHVFPVCHVTLAPQVFRFFSERIAAQYPLLEAEQTDTFQHVLEGHEAFMKAKSEAVLGRADVLRRVRMGSQGRGQGVQGPGCRTPRTCSLRPTRHRGQGLKQTGTVPTK